MPSPVGMPSVNWLHSSCLLYGNAHRQLAPLVLPSLGLEQVTAVEVLL